jgi:hypothetical protein
MTGMTLSKSKKIRKLFWQHTYKNGVKKWQHMTFFYTIFKHQKKRIVLKSRFAMGHHA